MNSISDLAAHCIRCGFCLESCPTFVVTGKETESPRGRIYLIRSADAGVMDWNDESLKEHIDTCVGCRACETACPSGVEYGALLELARDRLEKEHPSFGKSALLSGITNPTALRLQLSLGKLIPGRKMPGFVSRLITKEPAQADKPVAQDAAHWPPLDESKLLALRGEVRMLDGCAMSVLYGRVNEATRRLIRRVGFKVVDVKGCCGALHAHNGHLDQAHKMASEILNSPDLSIRSDIGDGGSIEDPSRPNLSPPRGRSVSLRTGREGETALETLVVNSAGCGSFLKEQKSGNVQDISEFLLANGLADQLAKVSFNQKVTYHDACHLAHGQKITSQPRDLIRAISGLNYTELKDSDMCCGSGGIYNVTQPTLARQLLERKWANVIATGAEVVVTGNPGCHAWIEQRSREAGSPVRVIHTAEFLEIALQSAESLS
ncbi:MAG TPA: (Fe-S)-binding protein [Fimbriimonadaceae bacterium]|jgi:glycolate oxidase iron-sulfur subunit